MGTKQPKEPCVTDCGFIATERNRYFTGKYMTARDFQGEQAYFLSRHRLHNRLLHGWGIVCGLRVIPHPDPDCADRWVVVRAGIAIDCCGRELVLERDTPFELPLPIEADEGAAMENSAPDAEGMRGPFLLCLRYAEEPIEHVPALYAEGTCDPTRHEANRVREVACLEVCSLDEVDPDCWRVPGGDPVARCRDDCDDELPGPAGICLEPECPCGSLVPLALIHPRDPDVGYAAGFDVDTQGRRTLPTAPEFLTHIVGINWPHGGEITLSHLREDLGGRLEVHFDRKLLPTEGDAVGINAHTFVVQYGGVQQDLEFLPSHTDHPPGLEDDCRAVFTIDPDYIEGRQNIAGSVVYVTLKCDFILDCHENPVDGDHLRARLPSGNGVPGGTFESWFRVVPDGEAEEEYDGDS